MSAPTERPVHVVYWHRELPPLTAEVIGEHTLEADSRRVPLAFSRGDEEWGRCYGDLMARARAASTRGTCRRETAVACTLDDGTLIEGVVEEKTFRGSRSRMTLMAGGNTLNVEFAATQNLPAVGERLRLRVDPAAVHALPVSGE